MIKIWLKVFRGLLIYFLKKNTPPESYQALITLFCNTSGRSNDILHRLVKIFRTRKTFKAESIFDQKNRNKKNEIVQALNQKGYHILDEKLPDRILNSLIKYAAENPLEPDYANTTPEQHKIKSVIFDPDNLKAIRYGFPEEEIINIPEVQELLTDSFLLSVAQDYLGCAPFADVCSFWWLTNFVKTSDASAATMWHFDMDRIKWLKIFFYLTDVDENTGPHSFVESSHRSGTIPKSILDKGYARITDEEINQLFESEKIIEFTAKKGTILFEDTRGLHKGKPLQEGSRLMLQIQFSDCGFGGEIPKESFYKFKDEKTKNFILKNKKIYDRYIDEC
jgi:hypothetical protein